VHADVGMTLQISKHQEMIISLGVRNALNNAYYRHLSRYRILDLTEQGINIIGSIRFPLEFSF
jgi:outer membrane receptor protein involved in Fe transport